MKEKCFIKTPRQKRALEALLNNPVVVKDLGFIIGALNQKQTIFEMRNQGFRDLILTRTFTVLDRDGKKCRPGEYYIPQEAKAIAKEALEKYIAKQQQTNVLYAKTILNHHKGRE